MKRTIKIVLVSLCLLCVSALLTTEAMATSLFGSGSALVSVPGGIGSKVIAFDQSADGGACSKYAIFNSSTTDCVRVQVQGVSGSAGLHAGTTAALIPPLTIMVFEIPKNGIYTIYVWGETTAGASATPTASGCVVSRGM